MIGNASPIQGMDKSPLQYYAVYRVTHPASVSAFLGLAHDYVQRRNGSDFAHHWFIESAESTIITVRGSRNALSLLSEYMERHTRYLSAVEVVYHGWGQKVFKAIVDDLYARRLSLREGVSR